LWALSNLAAMARLISDYAKSADMHDDEVFFQDGTVDQVMKTISIALQFSYFEVYREGIFFLSILATECSELQMIQYLLNKPIIMQFVEALKHWGSNTKLLTYTLQALERFFAWDKENNEHNPE
jgi:hypothetical protein